MIRETSKIGLIIQITFSKPRLFIDIAETVSSLEKRSPLNVRLYSKKISGRRFCHSHPSLTYSMSVKLHSNSN